MSITIEELVADFKAKAVQTMHDKHKTEVIMELTDLEKFFGFERSPHSWTWLPKRFRTELVKQKVRVYKARGKDYVTITVKD